LGEYVNLEWLELGYNSLTSIDLSECKKLKKLELHHNNLTSMDVSHNSKLTDLYINAELFVPENKIIGLEKTSIIRLDCREGDLLKKSQDTQFI